MNSKRILIYGLVGLLIFALFYALMDDSKPKHHHHQNDGGASKKSEGYHPHQNEHFHPHQNEHFHLNMAEDFEGSQDRYVYPNEHNPYDMISNDDDSIDPSGWDDISQSPGMGMGPSLIGGGRELMSDWSA
jgi:hypothetical protein